jgi:hypothetical protein
VTAFLLAACGVYARNKVYIVEFHLYGALFQIGVKLKRLLAIAIFGSVYAGIALLAQSSNAAVPTDSVDVMTVEPATTRAGFLRFTDSTLTEAVYAPGLSSRLTSAVDGPTVRAALAELLSRSEGEWVDAVVYTVQHDADPAVREAAVVGLKRATWPAVESTLLAAIADEDAGVRAMTAMTIGAHPEGVNATHALVSVLTDTDSDVRAMAARSIGWIGAVDAFSALPALLDDASADVRLRALRAMRTLDPVATSRASQLSSLKTDADIRVSNLAKKINE